MNKHESKFFFSTEEFMVRNEAIWKTDEDVAKAFSPIQLKLPLINIYHQVQKKNGNNASDYKIGL